MVLFLKKNRCFCGFQNVLVRGTLRPDSDCLRPRVVMASASARGLCSAGRAGLLTSAMASGVPDPYLEAAFSSASLGQETSEAARRDVELPGSSGSVFILML